MFKKLSLLPHGLRYKLLISFSLMSIIPLLVIGYLIANYLFLQEALEFTQISIIILFCVLIAWLGLFLTKSIVERVIDMALDSKIIMEGNYDRRLKVDSSDEVGIIGEAINFLSKKIRSSISDLRDYQEKMKEINSEIQKRVSVLSNLLHIGELIASSSVNLNGILELILGRVSQLYESGFSALYLRMDEKDKFALFLSYNVKDENLLTVEIEKGKGILGRAAEKRKHVILDSSSKFSAEDQEFKIKYKCENVIIVPIAAAGEVRAILVVGNNIKNFTYTSDDMDMVKVFTSQISIAIENDILMKRAKELEIKDELTELFNGPYITNQLKEEIARSVLSQRPCSFILIDIDNFKDYRAKKGQLVSDAALKKIAHLVREFSRPLEKAGRLDRDVFAIILPETNKKGALEVAEKVRKHIGKLSLSEEEGDVLTASFGVSENPLDGEDADAIIEKAKEALYKAKEKGKNKVIGSGV